MWKRGELNAYQLPTGTIVVRIDESGKTTDKIACIYSRVSSGENKSNLDSQAERLTNYAIAKGYRVYKVVKEVGSGLNDNRKQLANILVDDNYNILIVEHKDRLARFGTNYLKILLEKTGKKLEIVNEADNAVRPIRVTPGAYENLFDFLTKSFNGVNFRTVRRLK